MGQLGAAMVEAAPVGTGSVETHVTCRFLEGRDSDPAVLERFGRQRRNTFHRHMRAGELGDRVVAVSDQDALVELFRPAHGDHVVVGRPRPGDALKS